MAHVYAGEFSRIDEEVLEAVQSLPDDFWVYAEFNGVGRNVDWFVTRAAARQPSVLMLMELKRVSRPLRGSIDSAWEIMTDGGWQEIAPSNNRDVNYYWQSVNTANALADWLWNHQHRYREAGDVRPPEEFKVWPDLVLLSPSDVGHRLPLGPPSRYGRWWYSLHDWVRHVLSWKPRSGITLAPHELSGLAEALGLEAVPSAGARPVEPSMGATAELLSFVDWLRRLDERVSHLEALLEGPASNQPVISANGTAERWNAETPAAPEQPPATQPRRPWTEEERNALLAALAELRQRGRSRALPTVLDVMNLKLGYRLQDSNYNGYGSARTMFDQARSEQIIKYGGYSGPNPLIYAPDEDVATT